MCLDGVRATMLSSLGRHVDAVESFVAAGRFLDAIKALLTNRSLDSTKQACTYILQELWKLTPFGFRAGSTKSNTTIELLALSDRLEKSYLSPDELDVVSLFVLPANNGLIVLEQGQNVPWDICGGSFGASSTWRDVLQ